MGLFSKLFGKSSESSKKVRVIELTDPIYFRVTTSYTIDGYAVGRLDNLIFNDGLDGFKMYQLKFHDNSLLSNDLKFLYSYYDYRVNNELSNDKSDLVTCSDDQFKYKFLYNGNEVIYYLDGSLYVNTVNFTEGIEINIFGDKNGFSNSFSIYPLYEVTNNQLFTSKDEAELALEEIKMKSLNEKLNKI